MATNDNPSRRAVLGQAAAMAGVLGVAAIGGCAAPPAEIVFVDTLEEPYRQKKNVALYKGYPNAPFGHRCGGCIRFVPPNDCVAVQGPVSANGWCQNYRAV
jgi:hypothetical protein